MEKQVNPPQVNIWGRRPRPGSTLERLVQAVRRAPAASVAAALISLPVVSAAQSLAAARSVEGNASALGPGESAAGILGEFQVNEYTTSDQIRASIAADSDGDFIVVWQSLGSSGTDSDDFSIQAQRFDKLGAPVGDPFQVNEYTTGSQSAPAVAMDADGDFVITWQSAGSSENDQSGFSVQARLFSESGSASSEFQVNEYTTNDQQYPSVAIDSDGDFVVAWMSKDPLSINVHARRFDNTGTGQGSEFIVNQVSTGTQFFPQAAMDDDGDFIVTWASSSTPAGATDTNGLSIQAQRYNVNGIPQGDQFQVNAYTLNNQIYPAVDMDADGDFVVVWQSDGSDGTDASGSSIQAQIFSAEGSPQGDQFQVNEFTTSSQFNAAVALNADGDFIVTWDSFGSAGDDSSLFSVQGRFFLRSGLSQHGEFQVNEYTTNNQNRPSVASDDFGDFIVTWESDGSLGTDNSLKSIQARYYPKPPLLLYLPIVLQD